LQIPRDGLDGGRRGSRFRPYRCLSSRAHWSCNVRIWSSTRRNRRCSCSYAGDITSVLELIKAISSRRRSSIRCVVSQLHANAREAKATNDSAIAPAHFRDTFPILFRFRRGPNPATRRRGISSAIVAKGTALPISAGLCLHRGPSWPGGRICRSLGSAPFRRKRSKIGRRTRSKWQFRKKHNPYPLGMWRMVPRAI
jgi:hypothetical protein